MCEIIETSRREVAEYIDRRSPLYEQWSMRLFSTDNPQAWIIVQSGKGLVCIVVIPPDVEYYDTDNEYKDIFDFCLNALDKIKLHSYRYVEHLQEAEKAILSAKFTA